MKIIIAGGAEGRLDEKQKYEGRKRTLFILCKLRTALCVEANGNNFSIIFRITHLRFKKFFYSRHQHCMASFLGRTLHQKG